MFLLNITSLPSPAAHLQEMFRNEVAVKTLPSLSSAWSEMSKQPRRLQEGIHTCGLACPCPHSATASASLLQKTKLNKAAAVALVAQQSLLPFS